MNDVVYHFIGTGDEPWRIAWKGAGTPCRARARFGHRHGGTGGQVARAPALVLDWVSVRVANALFIAIVTWWHPPYLHGGRVSWVAVLILVYPSIAPNTPRKTLIASLAAATTELVCVGFAAARHVLPADASPFVMIWSLAGTYICAFMAQIPVRIIRGGRQVPSRSWGAPVGRDVGSRRHGRGLSRLARLWRAAAARSARGPGRIRMESARYSRNASARSRCAPAFLTAHHRDVRFASPTRARSSRMETSTCRPGTLVRATGGSTERASTSCDRRARHRRGARARARAQ